MAESCRRGPHFERSAFDYSACCEEDRFGVRIAELFGLNGEK